MFNSLANHLTNNEQQLGLSNESIPRLEQSSDTSSVARIPGFQFNSKYLSVTWPRCEANSPDLVSFIVDQLAHWEPKFVRVGKEKHADGASHFHAAIALGRKCRSRDKHILDFRGHHPNIQPTRDFAAWNAYCAKEGNYLDYGELPNPTADKSSLGRSGRGAVRRMDPADLTRIASQCTSRVQWLCWAAVNNVPYAKDIWNELHGPPDLNTIVEGKVSAGKLDYRFEQLILEVAWVMEKCLIIVGESGIGKTTYAINIIPKPCLLVSHIDDLRKFKASYHKSILFDDVCFNHYPIQSQIHLVDFHNPRSIHVRYAVATIPAGTHKIFTCNENPIDLSHAAVARRCQVIKCHQTDLTRFN